MNRDWREAGILAALVIVAYGVVALLPTDAVRAIPTEDSLVQYLGTFALLVASVLFLVAFRRVRRARGGGGVRAPELVLLGLAALFFFGAGEEISWGQRIFGIATPEAISAVNRQGETTVHNLEWLPIEGYRLFSIGWLAFVLVIPLAAHVAPRGRRLFGSWLPLAAWPIGLVYAVNEIAQKVVATLGEQDLVSSGIVLFHARVEFREAVFAVLCAFTAFAFVRAARSGSTDAAERRGSVTPASAPMPAAHRRPVAAASSRSRGARDHGSVPTGTTRLP